MDTWKTTRPRSSSKLQLSCDIYAQIIRKSDSVVLSAETERYVLASMSFVVICCKLFQSRVIYTQCRNTSQYTLCDIHSITYIITINLTYVATQGNRLKSLRRYNIVSLQLFWHFIARTIWTLRQSESAL